MTKLKPWLLPSVLFVGFALRVLIPFGKVFNSGYVNFIGPDSYYHADVMRNLITEQSKSGSFWDIFVVALTRTFAAGGASVKVMEYISVFIPPLLAVATIYFVYVMGKRLFNEKSGLIAALFAAVLPGEFFARSLLGAIDHHAFEVFITTLAALFVVLMLTQKKPYIWWKFPLYTTGVIICMFLYKYSWQGAATALSLNPGNPADAYPAMTLVTNTEAVHVWGLPGNYIPLINCLLAAGLSLFVIWRGAGWRRFIIVMWAVVMTAATIWQLRFDYYLVIPVALLFGYGFTLCKDTVKYYLVTCVLLVACAVAYTGIVRSDLDTPSRDWNEALIWVRDNTPRDALIIIWWDYGYWLRYRGERSEYINGGQDPVRIAEVSRSMLLGEPWPEGAEYIIIDERTTSSAFIVSMAQWAGVVNKLDEDNTLVRRLYNEKVEGYDLVYGEKVKVFKIEKEIDG